MLPKLPTLRFFGLMVLGLLIGFVIVTIEREKKASNHPQRSKPSKIVEISSKKPQTWDQLCINCHSIGGEGGDIGPALDLVGDKFTKEYLLSWLKDPNKIKHGTIMPNFELSDTEMNELVTFLSQLKDESI